MDRRNLLGALGFMGFGLTCSARHSEAGDHGNAHSGEVEDRGAVGEFHLHFCGIHVAKHDPKFQLIVQHYCGPRGDIHQCLLFDSMESNAKLLGIEYIIPEAMYRELPEEEKKYWHPHTYEVLAGGLIAPGMAPDDEMTFMKALLTTWGKTWHTWPDPTTMVPMGEPLLMWAITGDGQIDDQMLAERDRQFEVSTEKIRRQRSQELGYDVPQVSFPKSIEQVGRQWTDSGADAPTRRR